MRKQLPTYDDAAPVTTPSDEKLSLNGFHGVSREMRRALGGEALASLARTDELKLLYLQMHSMRSFIDVKDRLLGCLADDEPQAVAAATADAAQ